MAAVLVKRSISPLLVTSPGAGYKKHPKIKGTRNYYFQTIGYCSRTKVKHSCILRRFYTTWPWPLIIPYTWVAALTLIKKIIRMVKKLLIMSLGLLGCNFVLSLPWAKLFCHLFLNNCMFDWCKVVRQNQIYLTG